MRILLPFLVLGGLLCILPACHRCGDCHHEKKPRIKKECVSCERKGCPCRSARLDKEERY